MQSIVDFLKQHDSRLALVEGVPGAGKTTAARALAKALNGAGRECRLYVEGDPHPADCAWQAVMTKEQYQAELREAYEKCGKDGQREILAETFGQCTQYEDDKVLVAYTRLRFPDPSFNTLYERFAGYELCDARQPLERFTGIHLQRWTRFGREAAASNAVTVFECAYLQNHIFELMGSYALPDETITAHMRALIDTVRQLHPIVVYIRPRDLRATLANAAAERKAPEGSGRQDWIDEIGSWVETSRYGRAHGLRGFDGVYGFCRERERLDELVLSSVGIPVYTVVRD